MKVNILRVMFLWSAVLIVFVSCENRLSSFHSDSDYSKEKCTVKFDLNNGNAFSLIEEEIVDIRSMLKEPAEPVLEGYDFDGWYRNSDCTESWNFYLDRIEDDKILYAKWSENSCNGWWITEDSSKALYVNMKQKRAFAFFDKGEEIICFNFSDSGFDKDNMKLTFCGDEYVKPGVMCSGEKVFKERKTEYVCSDSDIECVKTFYFTSDGKVKFSSCCGYFTCRYLNICKDGKFYVQLITNDGYEVIAISADRFSAVM